MARGKLKYKDVVGKRNGQPRNTKQKNKPKPRKKYSLYNNEKKNTHKRKFNEKISRPSIAPKKTERKRQKVENPPAKEIPSDSESEVEDYMVKLRKALGCDSNNKKAIESESETEEEDMDVENTEEEKNKDDMSASENEEMGNKTDEDEPEFGIETQNEEDDTDNSKDPFVRHVFYELHESLLESVQNYSKSVNSLTKVWPKLGTIYIQIPKCDEISAQVNNEISLSEKKVYAPPGELPKEINIRTVKPEDLFIKTQICKNLFKANKNNVPNQDELFTPLQGEIFSIINNYQDLYYPERTFKNGEEIRYTYCLHAVNHILKTRLKVIHHNTRLSKKDEVPEEFRDQGLVRPKVLIIVPFKDAAYRIIKLMIDLILPEDKGNVMNKKRFVDDYTGNELIFPKKNPKPEDYEQIFQGNSSDDFKIGITVTKKSLKLYANFYSSDIIIASPLGLRRIIGAEGEQERDYDFLASIELLIMDQTEIFLMQNWDHVFHILNHMHLQPKEFHGTDLFRVRTWSLNGWAKYYRQTLIFSSLNLPEINAIFNKKSLNYAGKVKVMNPIEFGSISQVVVQIPHVFQRFEAQSHVDAIDARFDFFVNKVLPKHRDNMMRQTLIYIPSYFDYVRVRNYFKREDIGFVQICEYSEKRKVARARDIFFHGDAHFLLYTERYHFFNRNRIKGIRHIIFYQPPVFPHFFSEMCNLMQEYNMNKKVGSMLYMTVTVIYSKYDALQLSSIVGTERAAKICQSDRKVHVMVTERD